MKTQQAKDLHQGDEITWNNPNGESITDTILSINVINDVAEIVWSNGDFTECFISELS